ncbi:MAG: pyridoxamine 5'-phosphate oxidase family protein [Pseudomonadota bacterium]
MRNIVTDPRVTLLFLIPGAGQTLRVSGRAHISTHPELLQRFAMEGSRRSASSSFRSRLRSFNAPELSAARTSGSLWMRMPFPSFPARARCLRRSRTPKSTARRMTQAWRRASKRRFTELRPDYRLHWRFIHASMPCSR